MIDYKKLWRHLVTNHLATSTHVIQYAILRAIEQTDGNPNKAKKLLITYLAKAFTPVRRQSKLENGREPYDSLHRVINGVNARGEILGAPFKALDPKYQQVYIDLLTSLCDINKAVEEYAGRHYVYIFVRQDLFHEYQLVQAAHVALKAGFTMAKQGTMVQSPDNLYFTVVGVKNETELSQAIKLLMKKRVGFVEFVEPDIGHQMTAIATTPIRAMDRGELMKYKLLRFTLGDIDRRMVV